MEKIIPIVMAPESLSEAAHSHAASAGTLSLPGVAPSWIRVAGHAISEADIAREMQFHRSDDPHESRRAAAHTLVVRELLRRECERIGLGCVEMDGMETDEEARIRVLLDREAPAPEPDEAACRRYYDANRERFRGRDRLKLRHILLAAPPADSGQRLHARELGEQLIERLQAEPGRFAEFAVHHSACPSASEGGCLGWIEPGDTTPEFERQVFMLKPGLAGMTVESRWGHHVVWVDAIERGEEQSYVACAERIACYLQAQSRQHAIHQYLRQLQYRYGVQGLDD